MYVCMYIHKERGREKYRRTERGGREKERKREREREREREMDLLS